MFIVELLRGDPSLTPSKLYQRLSKSGDKDRNKEGGLGSAFKQATRVVEFYDAFSIDDDNRTVAIRNIATLYSLATKYKTGSSDIKQNINKYAICLALIVFLEKPVQQDAKHSQTNLTHTSIALDELAQLYKKDGLLTDVQIPELSIPISVLIERKRAAYDLAIGASVVSKQQIRKGTDKPQIKSSTHGFVSVTLQTTQIAGGQKSSVTADLNHDMKTSEADYIQIQNIERRIANFSAYSGTLMELYNGPDQPSFFIVKTMTEFTDLLSEKLDFTNFFDSDTFKAWLDRGCPGAAEMDIGSIDMAEDDYHLGNAATRNDNRVAVRYDFDHTFGEVTYNIRGGTTTSAYIKSQKIAGREVSLHPLTWTEGYNFHEDDLANLPLLATAKTRTFSAYEWTEHYAPYNWWTFSTELPSNVQDKIDVLPKQENYLKAKFRSMLEKIILPQEIYQLILDQIPFDKNDRDFVVAFRKKRRDRWRDKSLKTPGFLDYMHKHGEAALIELKQRLQNFLNKRKDIIKPDDPKIKKIMLRYDENFKEFAATIPKPPVIADEKKLDEPPKPKQSTTTETVNELLKKMAAAGVLEEISAAKAKQLTYFVAEIKKLTLEELNHLNVLMHQIQTGLLDPGHFTLIRTERRLGGGNTKTWRTMRTNLKETILAMLKHNNQEVKDNYQHYASLFHQYSGRSYSHWGKPATLKRFEADFPEQTFAPARKPT